MKVPHRNLFFALILFLIVYLTFELICFGALSVFENFRQIEYTPLPTQIVSDESRDAIKRILEGELDYLKFDGQLGWSLRENVSAQNRINSQGIRSTKEYTPMPPKGVLRIATFGDSFTFCHGVADGNTWQDFLRHKIKGEVLNFGVPGYGLDQAYLRYLKERPKFPAHITMIGFMPDNFFRHMNIYRPFISPSAEIPYTKPRFYINDNKLTLINNPIKSYDDLKTFAHNPKQLQPLFKEHDYFYTTKYKNGPLDFLPSIRLIKILSENYRQQHNGIIKNGVYNNTTESYAITLKIFDAFVNAVKENNSVPIIIIFPDENDIKMYRKKRVKRYGSLLTYLDEQQYRYIDVMDAIEKHCQNCPLEKIINVHYSPTTNVIVAKAIVDYIFPKRN